MSCSPGCRLSRLLGGQSPNLGGAPHRAGAVMCAGAVGRRQIGLKPESFRPFAG